MLAKIITEMKKVTWSGLWLLTFMSMAVAIGGAISMFMYREASRTWEARYYHVAGQLEALRAQMRESEPPDQVVKQEIVISVAGSEFSKRTRALANRNYLNIKTPSNTKWLGQIGEDDQKHAIFSDAAYSIRAGYILITNYEKKYGLNTVRGIICRFAEGNQKAYINFVCKRINVDPDEVFNVKEKIVDLLKAMVQFETGEKLGREHLELLAVMK